MDRNSLLNDQETAIRYGQDELQSRMWTAMPAIVQSVNLSKMTCEVQPAIKGIILNPDGSTTFVNLPLLVDCPIVFPSAGGFALTFPIVANDEVLIIIASRCIDAWFQNGGVQIPMESRMHDLSDGYALPGPHSLPKVLPSISSSGPQLRNNAGTVYMGLTAGGLVALVNPTGTAKSVLNGMLDLQSQMDTILTTFAGALSGATDPVVVAAGAALAASLGILSAQITAYKVTVGNLFQ